MTESHVKRKNPEHVTGKIVYYLRTIFSIGNVRVSRLYKLENQVTVTSFG